MSTLPILALMLAGPKVATIKAGSPDHRQLCALATPWINKNASFRVRIPGTTARSYGDWAYLRSKIVPMDPKNEGDGGLIALFKRKSGKWAVVQISAGSEGLNEETAGWAAKYRLPKALFAGGSY